MINLIANMKKELNSPIVVTKYSIKRESIFNIINEKRLRTLYHKRSFRQCPQFLYLANNAVRFISGKNELISAVCHIEGRSMYEI